MLVVMEIVPHLRRLPRYLWREWVRPLAVPLLAIAAAKSSLADINPVPTGSMQPTILCGDAIVVNKLSYDLKVPFTKYRIATWDYPARGDIVVCFAPDDKTRLVKRVVGVPGDMIELRRDVLYINGVARRYTAVSRDAAGPRELEPAERDIAGFAREQLGTTSHLMMLLPHVTGARDFGPVRVPPKNYFMLGDNRNNSRDSRYFGFMPREEIVGRATGVAISGDTKHWLRPRFSRFFSRVGINSVRVPTVRVQQVSLFQPAPRITPVAFCTGPIKSCS